MQKSFLSYRQAQLAYFDEGRGPAILFLPGFLEHSGMWSCLWPLLPESWRKLSLDLPGHGQSGNLGYIHTMDEMAATAKALVDHLGLGKVLLCGHSMGGYVALAFLERYPSLVRGIILLNSSAFPDSEVRKANRQRAIKLVKQDPAAYVRQAIPLLFAPQTRRQNPQAVEEAQKQGQETSAQGMVAALEGMRLRPDRRSVLQEARLPKMLIAGKDDPIIPWRGVQEQANQCGASFISASWGHMSHWEDPLSLREAMGDFLEHF